jgi:hypothetical protein
MAKKKIDLVTNNVPLATDIVIENAVGTDEGAWSPARALQVKG